MCTQCGFIKHVQACVDAGAALDDLEGLLGLLRLPDRALDDATCAEKLVRERSRVGYSWFVEGSEKILHSSIKGWCVQSMAWLAVPFVPSPRI